MPHWQLYYHIVWATRQRLPLLDANAAVTVERSLRASCDELRAIVHAIGVMPDHVHVAVSIPPSISISDVVKRLKGSSSHLLNHGAAAADGSTFAWETEYGVYSFREKDLGSVVAYVANQPSRHAAGQVWNALEQTESMAPHKGIVTR